MKSGKQSSEVDETDGEALNLDIGNLLRTLRRNWWIVPVCLLFTVGLAFLYIVITPKTYRSEEVVQVEQSETKVLNIEELKAEDLKQDAILATIESNIVSGQVLGRVIDDLKLTPGDIGLKPTRETPYLPQELVEALSKRVSAKLQRGTRLINVSADGATPALAQKIAKSLVTQYSQNDAEERSGVSGEANRFLLVQSDELKKRVETAEQAAQAYRDAHPDVALDDTKEFIEDKLRDLTKNLNDARQNRIQLESDYEQAKRILAEYKDPELTDKLLTINSVKGDQSILLIENSIATEEAAFAAIKQRYLPKHPSYIQEENKLKGFHASLSRAVVNTANGLATAVAAARDSENQITKLVKQSEQDKLENDRLQIPYTSLTREVDRNRGLYDTVQERLKETDITANVDANNIEIVTPASLPFEPVKPKSFIAVVAAVAFGSMMSVGLGLVFSAMDHSLKSLAQAEMELRLPAVGAIPVGEGFGAESGNFSILEEPHAALAEAFRTLRTAVDLLDGGDGKPSESRSFLFTSAVPGEGKSFCSINYSISSAQLGRKTLLVDADLRLPTIERAFFTEKKALGLSNLLEGSTEFTDCIYPTSIPNLSIMPVGKRSQNPSELMSNAQLPALVSTLLHEFDCVVFDTAPVHAVSDTLLLAKHINSCFLVVDATRTAAQVARAAIQQLVRANAKLAGFVLNRVPQSSSYYYYTEGSYGASVYGALSQTEAD